MVTNAVATDFEEYLVSKNALTRQGTRAANVRGPTYRMMYERSTLEPGAFAQAVADFHGLPRASLDTMRAGRALIEAFSTRFLRDMGAFPYETADGELRLAVADPSDTASLRAIELTLGQACLREVAAFDEIELVLRLALESAEA